MAVTPTAAPPGNPVEVRLAIDPAARKATATFYDDKAKPVDAPLDSGGTPVAPRIVSTDTGLIHVTETEQDPRASSDWIAVLTPVQPGHPDSRVQFGVNPIESGETDANGYSIVYEVATPPLSDEYKVTQGPDGLVIEAA
jgi:hypothetical protein